MNEEDIESRKVPPVAPSSSNEFVHDANAAHTISERDSVDEDVSLDSGHENRSAASSAAHEIAHETAYETAHAEMPTDDTTVDFLVAIGSSAGGLEALELFFQNMPLEEGLAFVVIQHMSPNFKSLLNELLARHTQLPIYEIENGMPLLPNRIYLAPPRQHIICSDGRLVFVVRAEQRELHMPIDTFFQSMAEEFGNRSIVIILSGTGSDGSHHLTQIADAGGLILAQDGDSAGFDGMPRSAISTGHVHMVGIPQELPRKIMAHIEGERTPKEFTSLSKYAIDEDSLSVLFAVLKQHFPVDFNMYKQAAMKRCVQRRLSTQKIENVAQYIERIGGDSEERNLLIRDLLIDVTAFFRDPDAFMRLNELVLPRILEAADTEKQVRLWVAGCATGEEVYTLAMLVLEYIWNEKVSVDVRIFATDVHEESLEIASTGFYSAHKVADIPPDWLRRYFVSVQDGYRVTKQMRDMVIFAPHNLIQDPPFTKIELVCCRNLLIYLNAAAQKKVIANLHFSLRNEGFLMLGPSEQVESMEDGFEHVDRYWHIYRKVWREKEREMMPISEVEQLSLAHLRHQPTSALGRTGESDLYVKLLEKYMPNGLLVNENYELLHIFGNASDYLKPMMGQATLNVLRLVSNDLHMALRSGLYHTSRQNTAVVYRNVRAETSNGPRQIHITVEAFSDRVRRLQRYLIVFELITAEPPVQASVEPEHRSFELEEESIEHIQMLERELQYTKHYLQTTIEELEATNEELQSTNEELVVSNEELQSTNEELHSVNEELYTVNVEYQQKIEELTQVTNDMRNLQENAKIAMIFLDPELTIREYTAAAADIFNLMPQDIKRPIAHLLYNIKLSPEVLYNAAQEVLADATTWEQEAQTGDGTFYLLRILPYLNEASEIEGVVLTFINVTQLKVAQMERDKLLVSLRNSEERYRALVESQAELICRYRAADFKILYVNDAARIYFNNVQTDLEGSSFLDLVPTQYHDELRACVNKALGQNQAVNIVHEVFTSSNTATDTADEPQLRWQEWVKVPVTNGIHKDDSDSKNSHRDGSHREETHRDRTQKNSERQDGTRKGNNGDKLHRKTPHGGIIQASGRDITERKLQEDIIAALNQQLQKTNEELEERVLQRTQALQWVNEQLRRSNEELDNFVYIASHDLKEPLRGIHNYVTLLQDIHGTALGEDGNSKLNALQRLSGRLIMQIEDLRLYSRMGRRDANLQPVDLNVLIEQILEDLGPLLNEQEVEVRIPRALPVVEYSQSRMQAIFQNLIANAAKYSQEDEKWVEIGVVTPDDALYEEALTFHPDTSHSQAAQGHIESTNIFYVSDNGIGIRPRHQERIFEMFKRLHPQDAYGGGTGAGLAIVKRILQQTKGHIWLKSEEGVGTCFWFTLTGTETDAIAESDPDYTQQF